VSPRAFLNLFTASALLGGLAFWPAACASQRLFSQARSGEHASRIVSMADEPVPAGSFARAAQSDPGKPEPHTGGSRRQSAAGLTLWKDRGPGRSSHLVLGERGVVSAQGVRSVPGRAVPNEVVLLRDARGHSNLYEVTAYSHGCILPRDGRPEGHARRAANGRWPLADITVAADTSLHPFGTEVLVEGVGFRTVGDRGHAIKGRKLDLFVDSCAEARRFGRRWLRVHAVPSETTLEGAN